MANDSPPHGQFTAEPIAHFKSIPWCNELLSDKRIIHVAVPDRRPKPEKQYTLVNETLNGPDAVRACVTYFRLPKRQKDQPMRPGESKENPFVEIDCLMDLGDGITSYAHTVHGGFQATVFDEVMGTAAWQQAGDNGAYTQDISIKYKKPMLTPTVVRCVGGVVAKEGRRITVEATFMGKDGSIHSEARAVFMEMNRNIGKAPEKKYGTGKSNL